MSIIRYYKNLITDEHCTAMGNELISAIENNTAVYNVYAVCVTENENTIFEILNTKNLLLEKNKFNADFGIVALVRGKSAALATVEKLLRDWLQQNEILSGIKDYYYKNCD